MFAEVPEREARRGFGHVGFAIEDDQLALAEPAAADRGVLRHLDRDRDVGFALVELADQIVVVDGLPVEIDVGLAGETARDGFVQVAARQRRARSEEHSSELQSLMRISYAFFFLIKKLLFILL